MITVLDSIIDFEAQCDYYSPNLVYSIGLKCEGKDTINIQIGSLGYDIMKSKAHLGCFVYRGHLFVVSGRYLDKVLFYKTDERKIIEYYKSKGNIGNNQRNKIILDIIEDDSFSFWIYKYINGNMVFLNRYDTYCK
ncbi:hypothetical protein SDC9_141532 [bioreactor metagenome]|uniref:Uncharacterized protein n=1 Tax=bioreactor metagenome TaxID=1076179 RepID=A0A645DYG6_9ZZZZ